MIFSLQAYQLVVKLVGIMLRRHRFAQEPRSFIVASLVKLESLCFSIQPPPQVFCLLAFLFCLNRSIGLHVLSICLSEKVRNTQLSYQFFESLHFERELTIQYFHLNLSSPFSVLMIFSFFIYEVQGSEFQLQNLHSQIFGDV